MLSPALTHLLADSGHQEQAPHGRVGFGGPDLGHLLPLRALAEPIAPGISSTVILFVFLFPIFRHPTSFQFCCLINFFVYSSARAVSALPSPPLHHLLLLIIGQIYRALNPTVSREALDEILNSLARCFSSTTPESLALIIETLTTLVRRREMERERQRENTLHIFLRFVSSYPPLLQRRLVEPLDSNRLMLFTNLFWATVAVLHTDYEELFSQVRTRYLFLSLSLSLSAQSLPLFCHLPYCHFNL